MYTCTRLGTPTRTRTHADTHGRWTQRAHTPGRLAFPGLPCLCPAPPPTPGHLPSLHREGASPSRGCGALGAGQVRPLGPQGAFSSPFKKNQKPKKKKKGCIAKQPRTGLLGKRLFQKTEETFLKRENSSKDSRQVPCAASISCTRFLYSIFLALLRPSLLRGGSDPASQGLVRLSPSPKCALCPVSGPAPTTTTSISLVAHGVP